jgi:hypothetical protein
MGSREYRLVVGGELSDRMQLAFEGMNLTRGDGTTILTGTIRDQAELQGVLQRITDLGLTLLELTAVDNVA